MTSGVYIRTREARRKLSESRKGKHFSEEHRRNISDALKGNKNSLGKHHSEESKRKLSESLKGRIFSEETRKKLSESTKGEKNHNFGKHFSEKTCKKLSETHKGKKPMYGKHHSEKTCKKLSETHKGHIVSEETKRKIGKSNSNPSEETRKRLREARRHRVFPKYKTKPELKFMELIEKYNLPYKFTGDSRFWIENINPDFVNCNGEKVCVEIFGDYWHNLPKAIKRDKEKLITLQKYGWKRIVIWEHEVYNENLVLSILNKKIWWN